LGVPACINIARVRLVGDETTINIDGLTTGTHKDIECGLESC